MDFLKFDLFSKSILSKIRAGGMMGVPQISFDINRLHPPDNITPFYRGAAADCPHVMEEIMAEAESGS